MYRIEMKNPLVQLHSKETQFRMLCGNRAAATKSVLSTTSHSTLMQVAHNLNRLGAFKINLNKTRSFASFAIPQKYHSKLADQKRSATKS